MDSLVSAGAVVVLGLLFNFTNGFHDASNIVSTIVASRSMSLKAALFMTAALVFIGSATVGTSVARTIGEGIVRLGAVDCLDIMAAITAAIVWNVFTWILGIPSSSSHAIIGGLIGAAFLRGGIDAVNTVSVIRIFLVILVAPPIGFAASWGVTRILMDLFADMHPGVAGPILRRLQNVSAGLLALSHGANDGQKAMGLIAMALATTLMKAPPAIPGPGPVFAVPWWAVLGCSAALALGMLSGGGRIIKTVGSRLYRIKPHHGTGAMATSSAVVYACTLLGFPVSTTHIASSCVLGSGAAHRVSAVRWTLAREIFLTWIITLPSAGALAYGLSSIMHL